MTEQEMAELEQRLEDVEGFLSSCDTTANGLSFTLWQAERRTDREMWAEREAVRIEEWLDAEDYVRRFGYEEEE